MANPQTENGHTALANEILDALCKTRIPGEAMQLLFVIIRKTYGWKKKGDQVSLSQFAEMTGIKRPNIVRGLKKLEDMNLISVIKKDNRYGNLYEFIKDFDKWKPLSKKITLSKKIKTPLSKKIHTKEKDYSLGYKPKENNVNKKSNPKFSEIDMKGARFLLKKIQEHSPQIKKTEKQLETWANVFRKMRKINGYIPEDIHKVIVFATADDFWQANILSAIKLRKHFDTLLIQMKNRR